MTEPTIKEQEEMARWLGFRSRCGLYAIVWWALPGEDVYIYRQLPDFTDLTTLFKLVVPVAEDKGYMWSFHVGVSIKRQKRYWFNIWLTDLEEIARREKLGIATRFEASDESPGLALFWAIYKLMEEK